MLTLLHLYDATIPLIPASRHKDLKTAIRILAAALSYSDPAACPLDDLPSTLPQLYETVTTYLLRQDKSAYTIRNTKNNLSRMLRLANEHRLFQLSPTPSLPQKRHLVEEFWKLPRRPGTMVRGDGSYLPFNQWPASLQQEFQAFERWAMQPMVPGRAASLRKRPITVKTYRVLFCAYFGYLRHIQGLQPLAFTQLFDLELLTRFITWHIDKHGHMTAVAEQLATKVLTLTKQYAPHPTFRTELAAFLKTLPKRPTTYDKKDAWVSLTTLYHVGLALWPTKSLQQIHSSKLATASRAGKSLMPAHCKRPAAIPPPPSLQSQRSAGCRRGGPAGALARLGSGSR